jgi:CheY-like chemotaxis protein
VTAAGATPSLLLLVEDEDANRALVRAIVARAADAVTSFDVLEATSLQEARDPRRRRRAGHPPRRPTARRLGARPRDGDAPAQRSALIVVMSASVHPDDQRHAYAAGADLFLGKPIAPGRLTGVLQRIAHGGSRGDGRPQP